VPVAIQQALDNETRTGGGLAGVVWPAAGAALALLTTAAAAYLVSVRLYRSSEAGLAATRVMALRRETKPVKSICV
jgi:putative ABC transport system ATP-binding protein